MKKNYGFAMSMGLIISLITIAVMSILGITTFFTILSYLRNISTFTFFIIGFIILIIYLNLKRGRRR